MTLNILFFTISIKARKVSLEEAIHTEMIEKRMRENRDRYFKIMGMY